MIAWEIIHGRLWPMGEKLEVGVTSAFEARRVKHFDGADPMVAPGWVLDYHFESTMRFKTPGQKWRIRIPGTWHLYPPLASWSQDTRRVNVPLHAVWIRFHGAEKLGLDRLIKNPLRMARIHDPGGWLLEKVRELALMGDAQSDRQGDSQDDDVYSQILLGFMDILHHLLRSQRLSDWEYTLELPGKSCPQDPLIARVNEYLVAHLHEPFTLTRLAKALHTSVSTLHRRYGAASQKSISQTLTHLRISRVKQLLMEGRTAAEAADQTGFYDQAHLSRTFRRIEGIPPRQFLKRLKKSAGKRNT